MTNDSDGVRFTSMDLTDLSDVISAAEFAAQKHLNQMRGGRDDLPYIVHPLEVARILTEAGVNDLVTLQAAILHDVLEDTDTTYDDLARFFDIDVADVVMEVTDDQSLSKKEQRAAVIAKAPTMSPRAKLVKLADGVSNVAATTLTQPVTWSTSLKKAYIKTTVRVADGARGVNKLLDTRFDRAVKEALELLKTAPKKQRQSTAGGEEGD